VNRWYWLLLVPIVVPLLTFLYNAEEPRLFGFPLFYWLQLAFVLLGSACCWMVYVRTKKS
jgi:predicted ferric reductase